MSHWYLFVLAYFVGILFNVNPSCGSASIAWINSRHSGPMIALFSLIRIAILGWIGALAGAFGTRVRVPWGILMLVAAGTLLYTAIRQRRSLAQGSCRPLDTSSPLPWVLAFVPPPSGYIGLAFFFGGFKAPTPLDGFMLLGVIGLGLTTPVWAQLAAPSLRSRLVAALNGSPRIARLQFAFEIAGVVVFSMVGLAFIVLNGFHRPLLDLLGLPH